MNINSRVEALREWMTTHGVDAYLVPTADPHNSEYIAPHWICREWLTGFTGSAGMAVVTLLDTALWTDSRYWLQAEEQLKDTPFTLMCEGRDDVPSPTEWLEKEAELSGKTLTIAGPADMMTRAMAEEAAEAGMTLRTDLPDAFDTLWTERPPLPARPIEPQPEKWTGRWAWNKLQLVADTLDKQLTAPYYLFNDLADIAWLLNLRGADIDYNPVFLAYLIYCKEERRFVLFTHPETLTPEARQQLEQAEVGVASYEEAADFCRKYRVQAAETVTAALHVATEEPLESPVVMLRAQKNEAECEGFRQAMLRDGVAMVQFLRRLDEAMTSGQHMTERSADELLTALRAAQPGFRELSFPTIAGYAAHGAIVHYEADEKTDAKLCPCGLLLLDSGAQFDCGTTDITRTIALGPTTEEERRVYTLVLKGHLALARLRFPEGATGLQLDLAARRDLWAAGYDFGHGTGHGVGAHLCVHEGPHQIRKDLRQCTLVPFWPGMTVTDEPGVYVPGRFGVRIENVLLCRRAGETPFGRFLEFENLTLCPYDLRPVERALLTAEEVAQINAYHAEVCQRLLPLLTDEADRNWLLQATAPLA